MICDQKTISIIYIKFNIDFYYGQDERVCKAIPYWGFFYQYAQKFIQLDIFLSISYHEAIAKSL